MKTMTLRDQIREMPLSVLAARIALARRTAGLTLDQLGEAAETSRQHLISLEKGKHRPRPAMLERIARATDIPVVFFVSPEVDATAGPFRSAA